MWLSASYLHNQCKHFVQELLQNVFNMESIHLSHNWGWMRCLAVGSTLLHLSLLVRGELIALFLSTKVRKYMKLST